MPGAKVAFIHGLSSEIVDVITSHTPEGWTTEVVPAGSSIDEQQAIVNDADFLMVYGAPLHDDVLRTAENTRLVQLLAAGYDRMNLRLMSVLEVPLREQRRGELDCGGGPRGTADADAVQAADADRSCHARRAVERANYGNQYIRDGG